jgi:hypothetical protein
MPSRVRREHEVHAQRQRQAHAADEQPVDRVGHHLAQRQVPARMVGRLHAVHVVTHEQAAQFLEHQDQAVGHQHLLQVLTLVQEAEERPLQHIAQQHRQHQAHGQRGKEAAAEGAAATTGASA